MPASTLRYGAMAFPSVRSLESPGGVLLVALIDAADGDEVAGYGADLCGPLAGNSTAAAVLWSDGRTARLPSAAAAATMLLRFVLKGDVRLLASCSNEDQFYDGSIAFSE